MELTTNYIISQIFTIMGYALTTSTYHVPKRKKILLLNLLSKFSFAIAYILLGAWSALAMIGVALIRNTIFMINEKENGKREKINNLDVIMLIVVYAISIISAFYTYDSFWSLLPFFSTLLYTYSIFQKNIRVYRFLGIPNEFLCVCYSFYIQSISAIVLGFFPLVSSIIGYINEVRKVEVYSNLNIQMLQYNKKILEKNTDIKIQKNSYLSKI